MLNNSCTYPSTAAAGIRIEQNHMSGRLEALLWHGLGFGINKLHAEVASRVCAHARKLWRAMASGDYPLECCLGRDDSLEACEPPQNPDLHSQNIPASH